MYFTYATLVFTRRSSSSSRRRQQQQYAHHASHNHANVIDVPPNYDSAVRVHRPDESMDNKPAASAGRMTYYKNRAGDMVTSAKVYIYKPKNSSNNSSNATA